MKTKYVACILSLLLLSGIFTLGLTINKASADSTALSISSVTKTPDDLGHTFTVPVQISDVTDLFGFDIKITWDNSLITLSSFDKSPLNVTWGNNYFEPLDPSPQTGAGYIRYAAVKMGKPGFTGSGTLFDLTFNVIKSGNFPYSTTIAFDPIHTQLSDSSANVISATLNGGAYSMSAKKPGVQFTLFDPNSGKLFEYGKYVEVQVYATDITSSLTGFDLTMDYTSQLLTFIGVKDWGVLGSGSTDGSVSGTVHLTLSLSSTPYSGGKGLLFTLTFQVVFAFSTEHIWRTGSAQSLSAAISLDTGSGNFVFSEGTIAINGITPPSSIPLTIYLIQGDADCNGKVDVFDLRCVAAYYDQSAPPGSDAARFDLKTDGTIGLLDIVLVSANYGYYVPDTQP